MGDRGVQAAKAQPQRSQIQEDIRSGRIALKQQSKSKILYNYFYFYRISMKHNCNFLWYRTILFCALTLSIFQGRLLASRTLPARLPMSWNYRGGIGETCKTLEKKWNKATCLEALWRWASTSFPARVCVWSLRPRRWRPGLPRPALPSACAVTSQRMRSIIPNKSNPNVTLPSL